MFPLKVVWKKNDEMRSEAAVVDEKMSVMVTEAKCQSVE